jgi:hypothetical protein
VEKNFTSAFLRHLPENYNSLEDKEIVVKTDLNTYVFCKVLSNSEPLSLDNGDLTLNEGDVIVTGYEPIKDLIRIGVLQLI